MPSGEKKLCRFQSAPGSGFWTKTPNSDFHADFRESLPLPDFYLSNLTEAEQSFLFYREYVRHYPAMHCLRGVIALAAIKGSDQDRVQRLFSEITRDFPDVKTIQLGEKRPQSIAELFNLFEQFKK